MPLPSNLSGGQPHIKCVKQSAICIEGINKTYKDVKVWPEGSCEWKICDTSDRVKIDDISDILRHDDKVGIDVLILSEGFEDNKLTVPEETIEFAKRERRVSEVLVLPTDKAVCKYNELVDQGRRVAGLFHAV